MTFRVHIMPDAEEDIFEIYLYIRTHDSASRAWNIKERILATCYSLDRIPHRGHYPPELLDNESRLFREIHFKPWRIIYQIVEQDVFIHAVLDGRRKVDRLLKERMLRLRQN